MRIAPSDSRLINNKTFYLPIKRRKKMMVGQARLPDGEIRFRQLTPYEKITSYDIE